MKLTTKLFGALCAVALLTFVACGSDDDDNANTPETTTTPEITTTPTSETAKVDFSVGNTVSVDGVKYYVVSNSSASTARSASRAAEDEAEATELVKAISVQRATEFAQKSFGDTIVLLRVAGKVTVPQGAKEKYISAYNAVTADIPAGLSEKDFFDYNSASSDKNSYYRDTYLILSDAEKQETKGTFEAMYSSSTELTDGHTLDELLIDYSPDIIRKTVPNQYKIRDAQSTLIRQYFFTGEVITKESEPVLHYKKGSSTIRPSALIQNSWNENGEWIRLQIPLLSTYGSEGTSPGLSYTVKKNGSIYKYVVYGSSDLDPQSHTTEKTFSFNDDGTYTDGNIDASELTFSESATRYNGRTQAYNDEALSVPVDFVLNEDGSVSPGEKIYAWIKAWRDFVIANNTDASSVDGSTTLKDDDTLADDTTTPRFTFSGAELKIELEAMKNNFESTDDTEASGGKSGKLVDENSYAEAIVTFPAGSYIGYACIKAPSGDNDAFYVKFGDEYIRSYADDPLPVGYAKTSRTPIKLTAESDVTVRLRIQKDCPTREGETGMFIDYVLFTKN